MTDKIRHKVEEVTGLAKEKTGDATDNERLQAEGATEQTEANVKQAGDHVADAARDARDALGGRH
ncbi:CsbD family protein [Plantactinospora sonchi]|uniref:CsbD family protein n=1 Tax=Plantactinospora sonchi TaxID=1544735 RepID=A0ABU7RL67_9ACTN